MATRKPSHKLTHDLPFVFCNPLHLDSVIGTHGVASAIIFQLSSFHCGNWPREGVTWVSWVVQGNNDKTRSWTLHELTQHWMSTYILHTRKQHLITYSKYLFADSFTLETLNKCVPWQTQHWTVSCQTGPMDSGYQPYCHMKSRWMGNSEPSLW